MEYSVKNISSAYDFNITGVSYIGNPKPHTAMFVTKKVEKLVNNLRGVSDCLIFAEKSVFVDEKILRDNCFVFSDVPQSEYAKFAQALYNARSEADKKRTYQLTKDGFYIGENVKIGANSYIEPGCLIGHDVVIGENANIFSGTIIKNAVIGDNFLANEHAVIGAFGFTMAEDENGNRFRIPTLGKVMIGDYVEVGAHDNISCGSGGDTIIEDYVKIDALVHIGHDVHLCKNVEITAGNIVGGFAEMGCHAYSGINASIRNRISLGENCVVGMGSTVTKSVESNVTVVGNPAKFFTKG